MLRLWLAMTTLRLAMTMLSIVGLMVVAPIFVNTVSAVEYLGNQYMITGGATVYFSMTNTKKDMSRLKGTAEEY